MSRVERFASHLLRAVLALAAATALLVCLAAAAPQPARAAGADVLVFGYTIEYDGKDHFAGVKDNGFSSTPKYYYSTKTPLNESNYLTEGSTDRPTRQAAGTTDVYVFATNGVQSASGCNTINIKPKLSISDQTFDYDGTGHYPEAWGAGGSTLYFSLTTPLTFENYATAGSSTYPRFTEPNGDGVTVYCFAVPYSNPTKESCADGSFRVTVASKGVQIPSISMPYTGSTQRVALDSSVFICSGETTGTDAGLYEITVDLRDPNAVWSDGSTGSKKLTWQITKADVSTLRLLDLESWEYYGDTCDPEVKLYLGSKRLNEDKDFETEYSDNILPGTATVLIRGIGKNFTGTRTAHFQIEKGYPWIRFEKTSITAYVGGKHPENVLHHLGGGYTTFSSSDPSVVYVDDIYCELSLMGKPGVATITATVWETALYKGGTASFQVTVEEPVSLKGAKIKPATSSGFTYTGKKIAPSFSVVCNGVTLTKGEDYTVSYSATPKAIGSYKATIKGINAYTGTATASFKIVPKAPKFTTKTFLGVSGGKRYYTVGWTKVSGISGYSFKPAGKKAHTVGARENYAKIFGSKGKSTTLYVRAFKKVGSTTYASAWSKLKIKL